MRKKRAELAKRKSKQIVSARKKKSKEQASKKKSKDSKHHSKSSRSRPVLRPRRIRNERNTKHMLKKASRRTAFDCDKRKLQITP